MSQSQTLPSEELLLPTEPKKSRRPIIFLLGILALAVVLAVVAFWQRPDSQFTTLQTSCDPARTHTVVADKGKTLVLVSGGRETAIEDRAVVNCVVQELDMPVAVRTMIMETRALDGRQQASWDNYEASWTYHPDSGLGMIVQKN